MDGASDGSVLHGFDFERLEAEFGELRSELADFKVLRPPAHLSFIFQLFFTLQFVLPDLTSFQKYLAAQGSSFNDLEIPLKDLGFKAIQAITKSEDPLKTLRDISQNLPVLAHSLALQKVDTAEYSDAVDKLMRVGYRPDWNWIWVNGIPTEASSLDPFEYDTQSQCIAIPHFPLSRHLHPLLISYPPVLIP